MWTEAEQEASGHSAFRAGVRFDQGTSGHIAHSYCAIPALNRYVVLECGLRKVVSPDTMLSSDTDGGPT